MKTLQPLLVVGLSVICVSPAMTHPEPEVPVRTYFTSKGTAEIIVEICPRCLVKDPEKHPYLAERDFKNMDGKARHAMKADALRFLERAVEFWMEPHGKLSPKFELKFALRQTPEKDSLVTPAVGSRSEKIERTMVVQAKWKMPLPKTFEGYRLEALSSGKYSVLFLNFVNGTPAKRVHVLFPGESSFVFNPEGAVVTASSKDDED